MPKGELLVDFETTHPYIRVTDMNSKWIRKKGLMYVESHIQKSIARYIVNAGDVILSIVGSIGFVSRISNEIDGANLTENCVKIIPDKQTLDGDYLYYYLKSPIGQDEIEKRNVGAVQPKLPIYNINDIDILLPPLPEQKRIAEILSSLDDKIDLLTRENATLEAMAETIFRKWFIEEAKEDWKEGKLGDYINETIGGDWGKENPEGDFTKAVQCIRGTDIADLNGGIATKTPIRFVKENKFLNIEPQNGDLVLEISGGTETQSTGRVAYVNNDVKALFNYPLVFSNFCRLLRIKKIEYSYFLYCYIKYLYNQDEFFNLENGSSGIKNLDYKALLFELKYQMPKDEQRIIDFNNNVEPLFEKVDKNKQQIITLTKQRDVLLSKLMNG